MGKGRFDEVAQPWTLVAVDVVNSRPGGRLRHTSLDEQLDRVVDDAVATFGDKHKWPCRPDGDSRLLLVPSYQPKARVVSDLVREVGIALQRTNARLSVDPLRLRLAIDTGELIVRAGLPIGGDELARVKDMIEADVLRQALRDVPSAPLAVIVSDRIYYDVIRHGERGLDPRDWTSVSITGPKSSFRAWTSVPVRGAPDDPGPADGRPPAGPELGPRASGSTAGPAVPPSPAITQTGRHNFAVGGPVHGSVYYVPVSGNGPTAVGPGASARPTAPDRYDDRHDDRAFAPPRVADDE